MVESIGLIRGKIGQGPHQVSAWEPRCATIDKDKYSFAALRRVWNDILIVYCLWHLLVWLYGKLRSATFGIPSNLIDDIAYRFRQMACSQTKVSFDNKWTILRIELGQLYPSFLLTLQKALFTTWKDTWPLWVRFSADLPLEIIQTLKTNMLSEATIKFTKYTVLSGIRNKRKDILIEKLLFSKLGFHEIESAHARAGLVPPVFRQKRPTPAARSAGEILATEIDGVRQESIDNNGYIEYSVQSSHPLVRWTVVIRSTFATCDCPIGRNLGSSCKHIQACLISSRAARGRPSRIRPRESAPSGGTYPAYGQMKAINKPGRKRKVRSDGRAQKQQRAR